MFWLAKIYLDGKIVETAVKVKENSPNEIQLIVSIGDYFGLGYNKRLKFVNKELEIRVNLFSDNYKAYGSLIYKKSTFVSMQKIYTIHDCEITLSFNYEELVVNSEGSSMDDYKKYFLK
jgi:hypothetical protein